MRRIAFFLFLCLLAACQQPAPEPRSEILLEQWSFSRDSLHWETVMVPHDWAITGPFDRSNDLQSVQVMQNFETSVSEHTGRTGGLPYAGKGWYRTQLDIPAGFRPGEEVYTLLFDGAMSEARVRVNGRELAYWPLGYNSFSVDITAALQSGANLLEVALENQPNSSRWYPGAGLYRNVHLIRTERIHIPVWGTYVTTPDVSDEAASVSLRITLSGLGEDDGGIRVRTRISDPQGRLCAEAESPAEAEVLQTFRIADPECWSPESPVRYTALTEICRGETLVDRYTTVFGIRTLALVPDEGFFLNGQRRKIQGVCNHHDLGPLGAAVNTAALRHQLTLLKEMGCDAIRTSHNMPAPELVELCDEMGFMMMIEAFDEWDIAKCENGYHRFFAEWAEKDMVNMIRHYRNHPSVIMWGIGNEVPTQCADEGYKVAAFLQDICHREDPTRLVTAGMDQADCVVRNGFAQLLDVVGFNYRTHKYEEAYRILPQKLLLGSETASTVSSRGVYKLPAEWVSGRQYPDNQCSSYDLEYCWWSNIPDIDFAMQDDFPWTIGQFVWTGFDYLGEPTPYDVDAWPSHSSYFGIFDLASLPKDRYWLYRSQWRRDVPTLHLLPHWNWAGREGEKVPVFCYTSYPCAELFVNGVSQGVQRFDASDPLRRYRLVWPDVIYEPGEIRVVAYDASGREAARETVRTAGEPARIELSADRQRLSADGKDLAYITVRIVDKDGNLCPHAANSVRFTVQGAASFRACANGDATCLTPFQQPEMAAFSGQLTAIVQAGTRHGSAMLTARADGLESAVLKLKIQ